MLLTVEVKVTTKVNCRGLSEYTTSEPSSEKIAGFYESNEGFKEVSTVWKPLSPRKIQR